MSAGKGLAPMEVDDISATTGPSSPKISNTDWVKADESERADDYSFAPSEDDESDEENGLEELANMSFDTSFDMSILQGSIEKSKAALDLVVGKEVAMVVGKTGVGKSTLLQGIAGKKIQKSFHRSSFSGSTSTKAVFEAHDPLPNFEIGHAKVSKTKSLNAFIRTDGANEVVYLDSLGLEDTRGIEMDIANSALLSQVAKRCKSLRFVILIHSASLLEDRGNAFRSVIAFAKKIVSDFSDSKRSFMFLFTHSHEITSMSNSSGDAKVSLLDEIIQIAGATKDEDILAVLEFVRKSLKRNYPFADILHPTGTDYCKLTERIEKLHGIRDLHSASKCNLTISAQLKLEVAAQNLMERLQAVIRTHSRDNASQMKEIRESFRYLVEYIDVEHVHQVRRQAEEIIEDHKMELMRSIESEFARCVCPNSDFQRANAKALQDTLAYLQDFHSPPFSCDRWVKSKMDPLTMLRDDIIAKATSCKQFYREFEKMQALAEAFPGHFNSILTDTCEEIIKILEGAVGTVTSTDPHTLHKCSDQDISNYVENLVILEAMQGFCPSDPRLKLKLATSSQTKVLKDLKLVFRSWASKAGAKNMNLKEDLDDLTSYSHVLETMTAILRKNNIGINSLSDDIESTLRSLEGDVIGSFTSMCNDLKNSVVDPSWETTLHWMQDACHRFSKLRSGRWKEEMSSSYSAVISDVKSSLDSKSGELENMSQITKEHGMRSGERLGRDLTMFKKWKWFDAHMPPGGAFVENCCTAIEGAFQSRIGEMRNELEQTLATLQEDQCYSTESLRKLELLLPELVEIDEFLLVTEKYAGVPPPQANDSDEMAIDTEHLLVPICERFLVQYTQHLLNQARTTTFNWATNLNSRKLESVHIQAQDLESIFAIAKSLNKFQSLEAVAKMSSEIIHGVTDSCKQLSNLADAELRDFNGDFMLKADILRSIKGCRGLSHIGKELPQYKDVQNHARKLVALKAQKMEREIEESSDWDKFDKQLDVFKSAAVLDEFVSGEATARLDTLQRLREQKEGQVDDHIKQMIEANNFKGMCDFLTPLAESNDQLKRQKYENYSDEIIFNLKLIIREIRRCIDQELMTVDETLTSVAENMTILATAKESFQNLLYRKLNLASEIGKLKGQINNQLTTLLDQIADSLAEKDFVRAAEIAHNANLFSQYLNQHIHASQKKRLKSAQSKYKRELTNVSKYVDKFIESSFKESFGLSRSLSSLKEAEGTSASSKQLATMYTEITTKLHEKVREFVTCLEESVAEARCFDDVIPLLLTLNRQINGPLKTHFPTDLLMDCENLLERLQKEKKDHDCQLEFGVKDVEEKLEYWAKELDNLESPALYRRFLFFLGPSKADRASYNCLKRRLTIIVDGRMKEAKEALDSQDFRSAQECYDFLVLVESKLLKHIKRVSADLRSLREKCIDLFLGLCCRAKEVLEAGEIIRFEEKFAEYRGFVVRLPCILASKESKREFSLINQMLYESFSNHIGSFLSIVDAEVFDFSRIRLQVLELRKLGNFFADRITLLNEEVESDKWLDKIQGLCAKHFSNGRDFSKLKDCVVLGVVPSATAAEIKRAYRQKAKLCHPDKTGDRDSAMFRKVNEAQESLLAADHLNTKDRSQPFDEVIKGISANLRALSKRFMEDQRYDMAEKFLFQLPALKEIGNLVTPKLQSKDIESSVHEVVKGHVEKMKVDVDTCWAERRYKDLNDSITDLKEMERAFKSYQNIFATSWNAGIIATIEAEIESLGQKASTCLTSHSTAKKRESDFRRFFIEMGSVLVELPSFKAYTKNVMSNVLESCLDQTWGYGYLFELGLSLQKGDDSGDDSKNRIAQMLVSEFTHFKEVMTMVWNQETSHKPVEDTVTHMRGQHRVSSSLTKAMKIDQKELISSFWAYEKQYKSFLGEYLKPDANLSSLVLQTKKLAKNMQPISVDMAWKDEKKGSIPHILAGIFSLFTVLKSGASYNRIEAVGGSSTLGQQLLMKPHNIQVLTILHMFGCGKGPRSSLDSQLMQIRTGEGKSMILGAAAAMFALDDVTYSKITKFAEDSTASKGNIRDLTESLLRENLVQPKPRSLPTTHTEISLKKGRSRAQSPAGNKKKLKMTTRSDTAPGRKVVSNEVRGTPDNHTDSPIKQDILLVDEVDVFFGSEFYGQTYNQVVEFSEPEITTIIRVIWDTFSKRGLQLRLKDIKEMAEYKRLLKKMASFQFLLDNEISLMLNQVKRVDDVPYYLDSENNRIGYKVMDSISYEVTYGYATTFAYLKESSNLSPSAVSRALVMPVSCGQFSYSNISPARILGVSGTLDSIGDYEKDVLNKFGLNKFIFVPSVYGDSNFEFDEAGVGICFESNKSNFFQKIAAEIMAITKAKRAAIVFFRDRSELNGFVMSPTYRQIGRNKSLLTEDMSSTSKEFVISKAATAGQVTLSTAVFGRGTDFFCKDESVERNGGVHIIQTFLSEDISEEVQIQGRTARQGKKGSYQMILLDSDLESNFGVSAAGRHQVPKGNWYAWLNKVRLHRHKEHCLLIEKNLEEATERDKLTHEYFDSLIAFSKAQSKKQFKNLYELIKKPPVPSSVSLDIALVIDVTGSMSPYSRSAASVINSLIHGQDALTSKLSNIFPEIEFKLCLACLGFRDIDDRNNQFTELTLKDGSHFTTNTRQVYEFVAGICASSSGGFDLAEDVIGALDYCANWQQVDDWTSDIKFILLMTDAPTHGKMPAASKQICNADNYPKLHPNGITTQHAVTKMLSKDVDLFFCSFNPVATADTEKDLSAHFESHPDNSAEHGVVKIPMVPTNSVVAESSSMSGGRGRHIIFVLDESGSMSYSWSGVVVAYRQYISKRKQSQSDSDLVSVVQFDSRSRITVHKTPLSSAPEDLPYHGGGTSFYPAAKEACKLANSTPSTHTPAIIFMSDGQAGDASHAAREFSGLDSRIVQKTSQHLELHVIAFGSGTDQAQLNQISQASAVGRVHSSSDSAELASVFVSIATNQNVTTALESEIAKRISEAVSDKLSLEYFGS